MTIELPRRSFLLGLASLIAAPAVVRAGSLMPVKAPKWIQPTLIGNFDGFNIGDVITFEGLAYSEYNLKQFVVTGFDNGLTFIPDPNQ